MRGAADAADRGDAARAGLAEAEGRQVAALAGTGRGPGRGGMARARGGSHGHAGAPGAARPGRARHRPAAADQPRRAGAGSRGRRTSPPRADAGASSWRRWCGPRLPTPPAVPTASRSWTGRCARPSRWSRRGSARWPGMPASTPRCWPRRADLVAVLRGDPDARLSHGWRAELLGDGISQAAGRPQRTDVRRQGLTAPRRSSDRPASPERRRSNGATRTAVSRPWPTAYGRLPHRGCSVMPTSGEPTR